ncbi:MAG: response regulator [Campylobacterales bacterium]|nr:response regulator [Campylobacterales bacterium]
MLILKEIQKVTSGYTVLYVEDEESIRKNIVSILKLFFKHVLVASDGKMGLDLFNEHPTDIIITDIQMPNMNGLEMIRVIRVKSPEIPVIITTAFSDSDYFLSSIELKVDQYLLKPIQAEQAKEAFYKIALLLENRKKLEELEQRKVQDKINKMSEQVMTQITNAFPNPCIIYTNQTIRYVNQPFIELFQRTNLEMLLENRVSLDSFFDKRVGFLPSLDAYNRNDPSMNKISITRLKGRKIYRIMMRELELDGNDSISVMITFNDVTWEEYQKVKIKNYTEILEEFIIKKRRYSFVPPVTSSVSKGQSLKSIEVVNDLDIASTRFINDEEREVLRRSHKIKTTAHVYVQELDDEVLQELQELQEIDRDLESAIDELQSDSNFAMLITIADAFEIYARKIGLLFEFDDLAYAIRSLKMLLISIDTTKIDMKMLNKLCLLIRSIKDDLASWNNNIFIAQSALDIHYIDTSLFSTCLQIELALSDEFKSVESSDNDFELF